MNNGKSTVNTMYHIFKEEENVDCRITRTKITEKGGKTAPKQLAISTVNREETH